MSIEVKKLESAHDMGGEEALKGKLILEHMEGRKGKIRDKGLSIHVG